VCEWFIIAKRNSRSSRKIDISLSGTQTNYLIYWIFVESLRNNVQMIRSWMDFDPRPMSAMWFRSLASVIRFSNMKIWCRCVLSDPIETTHHFLLGYSLEIFSGNSIICDYCDILDCSSNVQTDRSFHFRSPFMMKCDKTTIIEWQLQVYKTTMSNIFNRHFEWTEARACSPPDISIVDLDRNRNCPIQTHWYALGISSWTHNSLIYSLPVSMIVISIMFKS